jgi:hypothetical protein
MKKILLITLFAMAALTGCSNSFNRTVTTTTNSGGFGGPPVAPNDALSTGDMWKDLPSLIPQDVAINPDPKRAGSGDPDPKLAGKDEDSCAIYHMPPLGQTPIFPYKTFLALGPKQMAEADELQRKYITELRDYISTIKTRLATSYNSYVAACKTKVQK